MSSELVRFQSGPVTQLVQYLFRSAFSAGKGLFSSRPRAASVSVPLGDVEQIGFVLEDAGLPRHLVIADWTELKWLWLVTCALCFYVSRVLTRWSMTNQHKLEMKDLEEKYRGESVEAKLKDTEFLDSLFQTIPAWARDRRYDRTDWLSAAIQAWWPHIEPSLSENLRGKVASALKARAPLLVLDAEVSELHLGHSAPIVTSAVHSDSPEAVQIDMEVRWVGDLGAKGVLALKTRFGRRLNVTLSDVAVTATVRLALAPLVPVSPGFAAASLSLLSRPMVRYRITGVSAASAALPDLNAFLTRALSDCACAAALWPRRIVLPVLPDFDASLLTPEPAGVLRVSVMEGVDLQPTEALAVPEAATAGLNAAPKSPYVEVELATLPNLGRTTVLSRMAQRDRTKHVRNTLNPKWTDEEFLFLLDDPSAQTLRVAVKAWDPSGSVDTHCLMGETSIALDDLEPGEVDDRLWPLHMTLPKSTTVKGVMGTYKVPSFSGDLIEMPAGKVRLQATWLPFRSARLAAKAAQRRRNRRADSDSESDDDDGDDDDDDGAYDEGATGRGVLLVTVLQGLDFVRPDSISIPADAYVVARLDAGGKPGETHKTRVCKGSLHPVFNEHFALFCLAPRAVLRVSAHHLDSSDNDVRLGMLDLPLVSIVSEQVGDKPVEGTYELAGLVQARIRLRLVWKPY